ncbi:MAG: hypothetical protein WD824_22695 [Cyclobacteriaceae bacterium]
MAALFFSFLASASFLHLPPQNNPNQPIQFFPDWTPGMVVLETNDTVLCKLRFNQMVPEGLLQVLDGENVLTLSVKDVKCFFFFDEKKNRYRKFFTLSVPIDTNVSREMFLEYVYGNDKISILNHKTMGLAHPYMEFTPIKEQATPMSKQYLLDFRTGKLLPISEENALSLLDKKEAVAGFIAKNGIRFRKLSDYVKIFEYDHSL